MLTSTLTIHNVTEVDYTDYYVAASNVNGQSEPPEKDDYRVTLTGESKFCIAIIQICCECKLSQHKYNIQLPGRCILYIPSVQICMIIM